MFRFLNQVCAGLVVGFLFSFTVAYFAFQVELFKQGMDELGIGLGGFTYFLGGMLVSLFLMSLSKGGRRNAKWMVFFPVTVVWVGAIGLTNLMREGGAVGQQLMMQQNLDAMAGLTALMAFWMTPAGLILTYSVFLYESHQAKSFGSSAPVIKHESESR
ncbi:hypothetical protein GIW05_01150 [Pseudomonas syringae]|uniref:hypothetical protein n=1 Tax=Pseudomonas syringae TaxID=317 RepID=UPI001F20790D|nr:hypothetical protein [Pseudomonas syringae]MCF5382130.1 hypothetical protein [Pseudomonas syringae]MCF5423536.1 hypothetical protein [Pseudomonas syringae]MCF5455454.1 hypothetical protein [Pseudomonas syringae]MCF5458283.1 hypothetical protein [Pseudomonas syringae]